MVICENIDIDIDIDKAILENIDIDKAILKTIDIDMKSSRNIDIDIDIDKAILENIDIDIDIDKEILENINIDIDKEISENIDIDKILNRLEFGISNRATSLALSLSPPASPASNHRHHRPVKGLGELPNEKHHHCHELQVLP